MKITHYFCWHYAPPIYPNGDTVLWCKWCGFRQRVNKGVLEKGISGVGSTKQKKPPVSKDRWF